MTQCVIKSVNGQLYVYSWTTGSTKARIPKPRTEDEVQRECLRLERLGLDEEADLLLRQFCG